MGAWISTGLNSALNFNSPGPLIVFAPTNAAFEAIGCTSATNCPWDIEQLTKVLEYHVVGGSAAKSTDLSNMEVLLPLYGGHSLGVNLEDGPG